MPQVQLVDDSAPVPPDAAAIRLAVTIADIIHELRRIRGAPIYRVHRGAVAVSHSAAIAFGWLAPLKHSPSLLALTEAGSIALAVSGRGQGRR